MFGGIGARGGKKDRKQTLKNQKKNQEKETVEAEIKEKKLEKQKEEKKKTPLIPKDPSTFQELDQVEKKKVAKEEPPTLIEGQKEEKQPLSSKIKIAVEEKKEESNKDPIKLQEKKTIEDLEKKTHLEKEENYRPILTEPSIKKEEIEKNQTTQIEEQKPLIVDKLDLEEKILENPPLEEPTPQVAVPENRKEEEEIQKAPEISPILLEQQQLEEKRKIQEEILELKVANELERLLKEKRYELKKLYTELDTIQKEADTLYQVSDTEEKIDEIERLLDYLEQIKRQLEVISKSHNLDLIYQLDDSYFTGLVEEYKNYVKDQQTIEDKMKDLKRSEEYTSLMKRILEFEQTQEELAAILEDKKQELEIRDQNFDLLQDQYLDIEKVNQELESLIYDSEKYLETITQKVNEAVDVTTRAEIKMKYTVGILTRTLLLFSLMKMNPRPKANAVTAVETIVAIDLIRKLLTPKKEKRMVTEYHFQDYQSMIENALGDINSIFYLLQSGIKEVRDLRKTFESDFSIYADVLPEYKELLSSITKVEKELEEREDQMQRVKNEMQHQLHKNSQKVLEYERLNRENN